MLTTVRPPRELLRAVLDFVPLRYRVAWSTGEEDVCLLGLAPGEAMCSLDNHTSDVYGIRFFPWGDRMLSWSADGTVLISDVATGKGVRKLGHQDAVLNVKVLDAERILVTTADGHVAVWDATTGQALSRFVAFDIWNLEPLSGLDRVATRLRGRPVVQDIMTGGLVCVVPGAQGIFSSTVCPSTGCVASVGSDSGVTLWRAADCLPLVSFGPAEWMTGIAISARGDLAATTWKREIRIWSTRMGALVQSILAPPVARWQPVDEGVGMLRFFPEGDRLAALGPADVTIWNATTGERLLVLRHGYHVFDSMEISPVGDILVSCGRDGAIVWDTTSGIILAKLESSRPARPVALTSCRVAIGLGRFDMHGFGHGISARHALETAAS